MITSLTDLRLAVRGLRRSPLFATVAILSLALGIGANTALFPLIDQILRRRLRVPSALGRVFHSEEDDPVYQGHPVVVLSYDYWTNRFARDPAVLGRKILVNDYPMNIVGVSAQGFAGLDPAQSPQIRVPVLMKPVMVPDWGWLHMDGRRARWVQVFGRLKPGSTVESAKAPLPGLFPQ